MTAPNGWWIIGVLLLLIALAAFVGTARALRSTRRTAHRRHFGTFHEPDFWDPEARHSQRGPYSGIGPSGYRRPDFRIEEDINDRLTECGLIDATDIEVSVAAANVVLRGRVNDEEERKRAGWLAQSVAGVRSVRNELHVGMARARDGD